MLVVAWISQHRVEFFLNLTKFLAGLSNLLLVIEDHRDYIYMHAPISMNVVFVEDSIVMLVDLHTD